MRHRHPAPNADSATTPDPAARRDSPDRGRVGLCVLRVEPRVGGAVYTVYLVEDLVGAGCTSVTTSGALDASLDQIRAFAEAICRRNEETR